MHDQPGKRGRALAIDVLPGILFCILLAKGADWLVARLGLDIPGAALGLIILTAALALAPHQTRWSRPGAALLARWIGAGLVPVLVGLAAYPALVSGTLAPLALLLFVTTIVTGLATALIYRWLVRVL
ncbi:MAG: CidA/LrgA family protein [Polymorphobacter sp.]|uniref:CidA/LrgA family protein n=1 Tax=Polymorphobacter sp. TaxID=1909290 RepID=UPI003A8C1911